ncbi:MAG: ABC transporter ATP-binding protein/permease [Acidobacteria bacterium]|nr:ABC transporter ATP-binding protein/permease [Acidobacteriota bacterium]
MPIPEPHEEEFGKTGDARLMWRLARYLAPYKRYVLAALVLTVMGAPLAVAGPTLVSAAVDLYIVPDPSRPPSGFTLLVKQGAEQLGFGGDARSGIGFIAVVYLIAQLAAALIAYAELALMQRMGQFIMYDLRNEVFAHLHRLPMSYFDRHPVGRLMTRLTSDVEALNEMLTSAAVSIIGDAALILYIVVWMFYANWRLTLVTFSILPLLVALTVWFRRRSRQAYRRSRNCVANINSFLQEHVTGMSVVQLFNHEERELENFKALAADNRRANLDTAFYHAVLYPAVEIIAAGGIALIIWYGGGQVIQGLATLGTVVAFVQLVEMFYEPVGAVSEKYNIWQSAMAATERVFGVLAEPAAAEQPARRRHAVETCGRIEFRNVWFAYRDQDWVLKDVSFVIEPGERVAFVGHTGAGKTTLVSLLLRFYDVQRGQILLDGVDLQELGLEELRSNFAVVPQDGFLFSRDISGNIRLGNGKITDAQLREAARKVNADGFIERLSAGYASELRERGSGLSVGQKQLISLARALAFEPRILIMDEASSSIDAETEALLHGAVERSMQGRTSIIIAHRLSTVRSVDKIIVMHRGEIREVGAHEDLLRRRGLYWMLYRLNNSNGGNELS